MVFPPRSQVQFTTKMKKIVNHFRACYGELKGTDLIMTYLLDAKMLKKRS
ncbi:hypothetical protein HYC85_006293 [Camellia sinensis]|uniref:Uncharacterized protein n=1 Tax=Camellia sinensis TaxID=4442 RepID=A0A7J7HLX7_CAMSI|nr:hypothetical protein HYC85_006293 [Camellia sinensis]